MKFEDKKRNKDSKTAQWIEELVVQPERWNRCVGGKKRVSSDLHTSLSIAFHKENLARQAPPTNVP